MRKLDKGTKNLVSIVSSNSTNSRAWILHNKILQAIPTDTSKLKKPRTRQHYIFPTSVQTDGCNGVVVNAGTVLCPVGRKFKTRLRWKKIFKLFPVLFENLVEMAGCFGYHLVNCRSRLECHRGRTTLKI